MNKRVLEILRECLNNPDCPYCGGNLSKHYDCKNCNIDHRGGECLRKGHTKDCDLIKLVEEMETKTS